ncbi:MAG TPA: hypothetical protein VER11_19970 [Polyangiaceae bacterium]|nr:hypothetical protein [Polyangiaceae bacterium]
MDEFEEALSARARTSESAKLLEAHWQYDKLLLADGLQAVGATFPHYSRHDASHSRRIVSNIAQVLGKARIEKLGATDLWMILEAAHWHDVGMIVDDESARAWWERPEFRDHLDVLLESTDPRLKRAAQHVSGTDKKTLLEQYGAHWPLELRRSVAFVLADYARRNHASRSRDIVLDPTAVGIGSPRVLIPERLFRWLAEITLAHGRSAESAHKELVHAENGMGTDLCHPRFVAFMLRLGDLLDLDNGRFCAALVRTLGELPASSLPHVGKHAATTRLLISPEKIEVRARCADTHDPALSKQGIGAYDIYEATETWLGWLREELAYINQWWSDIAPPRFAGAPGYGVISAELEGYELRNGHHPRFNVDSDTLFQLVAGRNLYRQPTSAWLRELLANAKDATLSRAWEQEKEEHARAGRANEIWQAEPDPIAAMKARLKERNYRIEIELSRAQDPSPELGQPGVPLRHDDASPPKGTRWLFSIRDHGVGISTAELQYLLTVGASSKRNRGLKRDPAPEYWQPTGTFGIGMQSVFQVTDRVVIRTHHHHTHECREITLTSPAPFPPGSETAAGSRAWGSAYIRRLKLDDIHRYKLHAPGTIVEFEIDLAALPPFDDTLFGLEEHTEYNPLSAVRDRKLFDFVSTPLPALWPAYWWSLLRKWKDCAIYDLRLKSKSFVCPSDRTSCNEPREASDSPAKDAPRATDADQNDGSAAPTKHPDQEPSAEKDTRKFYYHNDTSIRLRFGKKDALRIVAKPGKPTEDTKTAAVTKPDLRGRSEAAKGEPSAFYYQGVDLLAFDRSDQLRGIIRRILPNFPWEELGISIEWYEGRASEYLNVDRDDLTRAGMLKLERSLKKAFESVMPRYLEDLRRDDSKDVRALEWASLYVHVYCGSVTAQHEPEAPWRKLALDWLLIDGKPGKLEDLVEPPSNFHLLIDRHQLFDRERIPGSTQKAIESALSCPLEKPLAGARIVRIKRSFGETEREWEEGKLRFRHSHDWIDDFIFVHFKTTKLGTAVTSKAREEAGIVEDLIATTEYQLVPRAPAEWAKPREIAEVEEGVGFSQELALIFGRSPKVRAALPHHPDYAALEVGYELCLEKAWHARGSGILRPSFVCPFELYGDSVELGHIKEYVEWVAKERHSQPDLHLKSLAVIEAQVACVTWQFVYDTDVDLREENGMFSGIKRAYSLAQVKRRLENRFNVSLDDNPEPSGRAARRNSKGTTSNSRTPR